MSDAAWIALAGVATTLVIAAFGGIFKLLANIGRKFTEVNDRGDARAAAITNNLMTVYERHEQQDQDRHTENVQRLTRLETMVNGHFNGRRRR